VGWLHRRSACSAPCMAIRPMIAVSSCSGQHRARKAVSRQTLACTRAAPGPTTDYKTEWQLTAQHLAVFASVWSADTAHMRMRTQVLL